MIEPWGTPQQLVMTSALPPPPFYQRNSFEWIASSFFFLFETMLLPQHCWAGGHQQAGEELAEVGGGYFPKHKEPLSEDVMKGPNVSNWPKQWRSQAHVVLSYLAPLEGLTGVFTNIIPSSPHFFLCCFTDDHALQR